MRVKCRRRRRGGMKRRKRRRWKEGRQGKAEVVEKQREGQSEKLVKKEEKIEMYRVPNEHLLSCYMMSKEIFKFCGSLYAYFLCMNWLIMIMYSAVCINIDWHLWYKGKNCYSRFCSLLILTSILFCLLAIFLNIWVCHTIWSFASDH